MTVTSRIATIKFSATIGGDTTGFRQWQATAATQDTAAGSSVAVTVTNTSGGASPPAVTDTLTLRYVDDAGTILETVTLNNTAASQTDTFFFTTTGLSGGTARKGTVEIKLQATKTTGGPTNTYDVETDGAPNTPPTSFSVATLDRGWIRGTTTRTDVLSNISLGGGKNSPAEYDESLFVRVTDAHSSYVSRALTIALSAGSLSAASASSAGTTHDVTFSNVCDNRFPAASTPAVTSITVPNATLTGLPDWTYSTATTDSLNVDPRVTAYHVLQIDSNTYATPPLSNTAIAVSGQRIFPANGYLVTNLRGARGTAVIPTTTEGKNGITFTIGFVAAATGQDFGTTGFATATEGGETGWQSSVLAWTAVVGGLWTKTVTITAPADIVGAGYLVNPTATYSLVATNPKLVPISGSSQLGNQDTHFRPGVDTFFVGYTLINTLSHVQVPLDSAATCVIKRFNFATFRLEYLNPGDFIWKPIRNYAATSVNTGADTITISGGHSYLADTKVQVAGVGTATVPGGLQEDTDFYVRNPTATTLQLAATAGGTPIDLVTTGGSFVVLEVAATHTMVQDPADPCVWSFTLDTSVQTGAAAWNTNDLFTIATGTKGGSPYSGSTINLITGGANDHAGYSIDPLAFAGIGTR